MVAQNPPSPAREPPTSGFEVLNNEYLLEEETFSWYDPEGFYPVRIGEIFQSKYQVLGKLGYGSVSTAWLCRDLVYVLLPVIHFS
jgi:serine/threonine-protein kinase SRPK3